MKHIQFILFILTLAMSILTLVFASSNVIIHQFLAQFYAGMTVATAAVFFSSLIERKP